MTLEHSGNLADVVQILNEVLAPVVIDRDTDRPYSIIRFATPPTIELETKPTDDLAAVRWTIRQLGEEQRQASIAMARGGRPGQVSEEHGSRESSSALGYWRGLGPEQIETQAAIADRRLDYERRTDHGE